MKNIILTVFTFLIIGIFLAIDPVFAGDRFKTYELAESGFTIEFKMTPEEIAAKDAENARMAAIIEADSNRPQEKLSLFEMIEMTVEKIASEHNENVRLAAVRKATSETQQKQAAIYELSESGGLIEFPLKTPDSN